MGGFYIGANSDKDKFLQVINLATGGGFSFNGNKLQASPGYKPKLNSSAAFRKKLLNSLNMATTVTLHFAKGYHLHEKSGKS